MENNKVLIPRFAANYITLTKASYDISDVFKFDVIDARQGFNNLMKWLYENDIEENERRYLMLVSAWVNGYEIEEDKYYWALSLENCIQPVFLLDDPQTSEKNYFADTVEDMKDAAYITESEALNILVEDFHMFRKLETNEVE